MFKLYALTAVFFVVGGSLYDFPAACFTPHAIGTCASVQTSALLNGYRVNWDAVDAIRTFEH